MSTISEEKTTEKHPNNRVVQAGFTASNNFYQSDRILRHFLQTHASEAGKKYMEPHWDRTGKLAATQLDALSLTADKHGPELVKRTFWGETVNEIRFHPAYQQLTEVAVKTQMFRVKWEPGLRQKFIRERHLLGFGSNFLFAMAEGGLDCPLCMTDGVALLIDRFCTTADRDRLLPHIYTANAEEFFTGAMFLTEKAGGSDVGANLVSATHYQDRYYKLNGEKWFCSNANAEIIFALARTNPEITGTRGLGIFLIEKTTPTGEKNPLEIIRLKDKLGVRSMASAECLLEDTLGKLVGEEGQGFKIMAEMVNLSRLYNSLAALAFHRRALIEAWQFVQHRKSFGKIAAEHPLIRTKLWELGSRYVLDFYLSWHCIGLLDRADNGDSEAASRLRLLTPMTKKQTAESGVYGIRECMELMGGMGYIEDGVMPKLLRDALVLPIWEGAGNIMLLDMLRASLKSEGLNLLFSDIQESIQRYETFRWAAPLLQGLKKLMRELFDAPQEVMEASARPIFSQLTQLTQYHLVLSYRDSASAAWIDPSLRWLKQQLEGRPPALEIPPTCKEIQQLLGWEVEGKDS